MKNSCGAILYTFDPEGRIGVVLGAEGSEEWLPFKGCNEEGETFEQTAIREIREETCGLVTLDSISLDHVFTTKHKIYRIGLCQVDYSIIEQFEKVRRSECRKEFREKQEIKFFPLETVFVKQKVHSISRASIKFYWDKLMTYAGKQNVSAEYIRCHGMTEDQAKAIRVKALSDINVSNVEVVLDTDIMDGLLKLDVTKKSDVSDDSPSDLPSELPGDMQCDTSDTSGEPSPKSAKATNLPSLLKGSPKDTQKDTLKDSPKDTSKDTLKNTLKDIPSSKLDYVESYSRRHDLVTFLAKRDAKYNPRRKSAGDSRGNTKREYNLARPRKIGIYHTPMAEKRAEESRSWR